MLTRVFVLGLVLTFGGAVVLACEWRLAPGTSLACSFNPVLYGIGAWDFITRGLTVVVGAGTMGALLQ